MDMSPLIPLHELHSHPSPSHSTSGHSKITSDLQNLRLPVTLHDDSSSSTLIPPHRQLLHQRPIVRRREILLKGIWQLTKTFLIPFITIAYLSFCYTVQYQVVPFSQGLHDNIDGTWLAIAKSGVTTTSIIIVSISLYPVHDLLSSLKSEEFFRVLVARPRGVPLSAINAISNPACGVIESAMLIIHNHCSRYFITAFIAAGIAWVVTALAPAALSLQTVLADGDIQAFPVGAIPPLSFYRPAASGQTIPPMQLAVSPGYPASIAWAEMVLSMPYAYTISNNSLGEYTGYVVPMSSSIQASTEARWLTDVVGLHPYCTWANPANITESSSSVVMNSSSVASTAVKVYLEGLDLDVDVPSSIFHLRVESSDICLQSYYWDVTIRRLSDFFLHFVCRRLYGRPDKYRFLLPKLYRHTHSTVQCAR
ncbi:hypothetical protein K503DRAFT_32700 [Rhizopogon vinicolor AM-OR11-026]|uniref:Uncharacterized protein n=1 Tax=Rhizopogon vinicolor AM-OR11-026 TaxID=1314800 RepID=A0A1B7N568_9AGAM|nr:hypothetical protein K503DRAFT_32700 [Rhizopogon vinicolor AM-OR11-026]